jgi:transposase
VLPPTSTPAGTALQDGATETSGVYGLPSTIPLLSGLRGSAAVEGEWLIARPVDEERNRPSQEGSPGFELAGVSRVSDRVAFTAIVFVLVTGVPWRRVPREIGGSGVTASATAARLAGGRCLGAAALGAASPAQSRRQARVVASDRRLQPRAGASGGSTGPSPVDSGRNGSNHHLICDARGIPRVRLAGGHRNDVTQLCRSSTLSAIRGNPGRPRKRPDCVVADRGFCGTVLGVSMHAASASRSAADG